MPSKTSKKKPVSAFDDMSLIQLIDERGPDAIHALPQRIKDNHDAVAETIENNVRKLIINESLVDPAHYKEMLKLLDALIDKRRKGVETYKDYLEQIAVLSKQVLQPGRTDPDDYPEWVKSRAQRALFNNLGNDECKALAVDQAIKRNLQDGWRSNPAKTKRVRNAVREVLGDEALTDMILELAKHQDEY